MHIHINKTSGRFLARQLGLVIVFLMCGFNFINAQSKGYLGKRFILKTTIINGRDLPLNSIHVEYAKTRRIAINYYIQVFGFSTREEGKTINSGEINPGKNREKSIEKSTLKDGTTKGGIIGTGFKYYFNNALPAPVGWYTQFNLGIGGAKLQGYNVSYSFAYPEMPFENSSSYNKETYARKSVENLQANCAVVFFDLPSFGYQMIVSRKVTFDASISLQGQFCGVPAYIINSFEKNYFTRTNIYSFGFGRLAYGPAAHIRIGILL